jgi:hypothetical protein
VLRRPDVDGRQRQLAGVRLAVGDQLAQGLEAGLLPDADHQFEEASVLIGANP